MSRVSSEHWQQVKELFERALEFRGAERTSFLERACGNDVELRKELDSLLRSYDSADSFMETPAVGSAAESILSQSRSLSPGRRLQHYEIISLIGEGGMGEVYLAKDTRLGRRVALKLLPGYLSGDPERLRRFKQEARAASTLSHPNVCVVHEVGETDDGHPFIAMEYIEGVTLRQRLNEGAMTFGLALDVTIQIADALAAAHEAGIVHRDIKPENIMLRPDGYVKVLDFGLAKLSPVRGRALDTTMSTLLGHSTPGMVMGTVAYMSPEQARGIPVDARTDIWSVAVVLYEMVTGRTPFGGDTPTDVIVSIIDKEQPPINQYLETAPPELERIVRKALRKDRDERYQLAKELAIDLRTLRREQQLDLGRSVAPDLPRDTGPRTEKRRTDPGTSPRKTTFLPFGSATVRPGQVLLALGLLLVVGALGFVGYKWFTRAVPEVVEPRFQRFNVTKLTTNGNAAYASISNDGKYVAYIMNEGGRQSLWLRQAAVDSSLQLMPAREGQYLGTAFSPDGNYLYYGYIEPGANEPQLYRIPVLATGAPPTRLDLYTGPPSLSHDGKKVAFVRFDIAGSADILMMADADGSNEQVLATRKWPERFSWNWNAAPAWSTDGQRITTVMVNPTSTNFYLQLFDLRLSDRSESLVTLTGQRFELLDDLALVTDGSSIFTTAKAQGASFFQLWHLTRDGSARQITNDLSDYLALSLKSDASSLVTIQRQILSDVWTSPANDVARATPITSGFGRYFDIRWTPDGGVIYASDASGSAKIYEMGADGSQPRILSEAGRNYGPAISPDGRYIAFHSNRTGNFQIWRANRDGTNPVQLTNTETECHWPQFSADGKSIVFEHFKPDQKGSLWLVSVDGGTPRKLTDGVALRPVISPDGKWIACWWTEQNQNVHPRLAIFPFEGGAPVKTFAVASTVPISWEASLHWTSDGKNITYVDQRGGASNLWNQSVDGQPAKQITDFKEGRIFAFDWARDGRLVISRGLTTNDVVLMTEVK
jgi:serine/threonine protein kinase/Tol biopolymer transport system component